MCAVAPAYILTEKATFDSLESARREAVRCLGCADAPCMAHCPVGIPIPEVNRAIITGNIRRAAELVRTVNTAAHVCGACCPQEQFCQSACVRATIDNPINIRGLHRFATDREWNSGPRYPQVPTPNKFEVGIVGGGPSSVACAIGLGQRGIKTHIFEKEREAGGLPAWAIPDDRLPVDVVQRDLYNLASYPITIHAGQEITSLKELREKYDAIYIGVGALQEGSLDITGLDGPDVYNGLEFLRAAKQNPDKIVMRGPVRIIGGGNVAVDCALVSSALGANRISVIYRRSRAELPAWDREVNDAFNRRVDFLFQLQPLAIERQGELIYRLICRRTTLGSPGEDGRRVPILLTSESISLETGMVILAAGQNTITFDDESLEVNDRGNIVIDEANRTSLNGIYAGGDATGKCGTVVEVVKSGLNAAFWIAKDLENR